MRILQIQTLRPNKKYFNAADYGACQIEFVNEGPGPIQVGPSSQPKITINPSDSRTFGKIIAGYRIAQNFELMGNLNNTIVIISKLVDCEK